MSTCPPGSVGPYPLGDWDEDLWQRYGENPEPGPITFHGKELTLPPPEQLVGKTDECAILLQYKLDRGAHALNIHRESQGAYEAIAPVIAAIGLSTDDPVNPLLKQVRCKLGAEIEEPIYRFKAKFMRARPWTCCGAELDPMLAKPHWRYPGQPAYPSGHATVAWFFAYLFGEFYSPPQRQRLESAAAQVARNREIAGVHYPSDSEAGKRLAKQLVEIILSKGLKSELEIRAVVMSISK